MSQFSEMGTAIKALSMRRENLYRSLDILDPATTEWQRNSREVDDINETMDGLERQRTKLRLEMSDV